MNTDISVNTHNKTKPSCYTHTISSSWACTTSISHLTPSLLSSGPPGQPGAQDLSLRAVWLQGQQDGDPGGWRAHPLGTRLLRPGGQREGPRRSVSTPGGRGGSGAGGRGRWKCHTHLLFPVGAERSSGWDSRILTLTTVRKDITLPSLNTHLCPQKLRKYSHFHNGRHHFLTTAKKANTLKSQDLCKQSRFRTDWNANHKYVTHFTIISHLHYTLSYQYIIHLYLFSCKYSILIPEQKNIVLSKQVENVFLQIYTSTVHLLLGMYE